MLLLCLKKSPQAEQLKRKSISYGSVPIGQEYRHSVVGSSTQRPFELSLHFDGTVFPSGGSTKKAQLSVHADSGCGQISFPVALWLKVQPLTVTKRLSSGLRSHLQFPATWPSAQAIHNIASCVPLRSAGDFSFCSLLGQSLT